MKKKTITILMAMLLSLPFFTPKIKAETVFALRDVSADGAKVKAYVNGTETNGAAEGQRVDLEITLEEGYTLFNVSVVNYYNGKEEELLNENGKHYFIMPNHAVGMFAGAYKDTLKVGTQKVEVIDNKNHYYAFTPQIDDTYEFSGVWQQAVNTYRFMMSVLSVDGTSLITELESADLGNKTKIDLQGGKTYYILIYTLGAVENYRSCDLTISSTHAKVTFDTNGGPEVEPKTVKKGEPVEKPDDPLRDDAVFVAWYSDPDLTEEYDFTKPVNEDMTLYARWVEKVIVTFKDVNESGEVLASQGIGRGAKAARPEDPTKDGYVFVDWYISEDAGSNERFAKYDFDLPVDSNLTIYAKWVVTYHEDKVGGKDVYVADAPASAYNMMDNYSDKTLVLKTGNGIVFVPSSVQLERMIWPMDSDYAPAVDGLDALIAKANEGDLSGYFVQIDKEDSLDPNIKNALGKYNFLDGSAFDAHMMSWTGNGTVSPYPDEYPGSCKLDLTITLDLAKEGVSIPEAKEGIERTYYIAHYDGEKVEFLDLELNEDLSKGTFKTGSLSPFAIVYKDAEPKSKPIPDTPYKLPMTGVE